LPEHFGEFIIEGNTIKKAYISHSRIRRMKPGDLILFYRSEDMQAVTSIGVVESVHTEIDDGNQIVKLAGKRTVFSRDEIDEWVKQPVSVFLFRHHFHLTRPLKIDELTAGQILTAAPRSATEITHESYKKLKEMSGIDGRFTID
jgi:predicted RNA-binding protein with PUA-like domain